MKELEFHYAHYTRTFQKQEILVRNGKVSVQVAMDWTMADVISDALGKVLDVFEITDRPSPSCLFSPYWFKNVDTDISEEIHVWKRELGREGYGDFIRVASTFPPEIQRKFETDWDNYMDYLSMPSP